MTYLMLLLSLVLLVVGANWLVDGAAAIARRYHMSEFIIGATIVGMGTSAPELVVSVVSSVGGHSDIAIGNIVGSNIFNLLLILGTASTICPLTMGGITFVDWGVMLLSSLILLAATSTFKKHMLDRKDALIFLLIYAGYMVWLF